MDTPTAIALLIRFIKAARSKKLVDFGNLTISLSQKAKDLQTSPSQPLVLAYSDLDKLILSQDVKTAIEAISVIETSAPSEKVLPFEFSFALKFITNCMQTTYRDWETDRKSVV